MKVSLVRRLIDALRGRSSTVELQTLARVGDYPDILAAHREMKSAQENFNFALQGVVRATERRVNGG